MDNLNCSGWSIQEQRRLQRDYTAVEYSRTKISAPNSMENLSSPRPCPTRPKWSTSGPGLPSRRKVTTFWKRRRESRRSVMSSATSLCRAVNVFRQREDSRERCVYPAADIPPELRMSVKINNNDVNRFRSQLPLPARALPATSLPEWRIMPLENKIPLVQAPKGAITFTRGALCQPLQMNGKAFNIDDPRNFERVPTGTYNSLHDPHAASYFNKPSVKKILHKNGLINDSGEVVCSLKEFNRYRTYLKTVYNESLKDCIKERDRRVKQDYELQRKALEYDSKTTKGGKKFLVAEKRRKAMARLVAQRQNFIHRVELKQEKERSMYSSYLQNKIRQKINSTILSTSRKETNRLRREELARAQELKTEHFRAIVLEKEQAVEERLMMEKENFLYAYKHFMTEWLISKFESQDRRLQRDSEIRQSLLLDLERKSVKRMARVERNRALMCVINERHKEKERQLWEMVRKYFLRWRDLVRYRKANRPDDKHVSTWDVHDGLKKTTKYLLEQAGINTFQELISGMVQQRRSIKISLPDEEEQSSHDDTPTATPPDPSRDERAISPPKPEQAEDDYRQEIEAILSATLRTPASTSSTKFKSKYASRKASTRYLSRVGSKFSYKVKRTLGSSNSSILKNSASSSRRTMRPPGAGPSSSSNK